jgi:hypothetical protein
VGLAHGTCGEFATIVSARVTMLRQHEKSEHTRADAVAALAAGRWRLAGLSARASVGFALDVLRAAAGQVPRDEIRRRKVLAEAVRSTAARREAVALLTEEFDERSVADYLTRCWHFIDHVVRIKDLGIPAACDGDDGAAHDQQRRVWLRCAQESSAHIPYSAAAVRQILGDTGLHGR